MVTNFPTKRQRGPSSYEAEVVGVEEGFVPNYGPDGRHGLYIEIQYATTGKTRKIFYPSPPAMKSNKLLEALENLEIDLEGIGGWDALVGYNFRWANEREQREITDRETGQRVTRSVELEYPVEILTAESGGGTNNTSPSEAPADSSPGAGSSSDAESFKDEVVNIIANASGPLSLREIRMEAASNDTIRSASTELKEKLSKGELVSALVEQGRIKEEDVDDGNGGTVTAYSLAL